MLALQIRERIHYNQNKRDGGTGGNKGKEQYISISNSDPTYMQSMSYRWPGGAGIYLGVFDCVGFICAEAADREQAFEAEDRHTRKSKCMTFTLHRTQTSLTLLIPGLLTRLVVNMCTNHACPAGFLSY